MEAAEDFIQAYPALSVLNSVGATIMAAWGKNIEAI
jgi:hypothetical protein